MTQPPPVPRSDDGIADTEVSEVLSRISFDGALKGVQHVWRDTLAQMVPPQQPQAVQPRTSPLTAESGSGGASASSSSGASSSLGIAAAAVDPMMDLVDVAAHCMRLEELGRWKEASEILAEAMVRCKSHHDGLIRCNAVIAIQAHARRRSAEGIYARERSAVRLQSKARGRAARKLARRLVTPTVQLGAHLPSSPGGEVVIKLMVHDASFFDDLWGGDNEASYDGVHQPMDNHNCGVVFLPPIDEEMNDTASHHSASSMLALSESDSEPMLTMPPASASNFLIDQASISVALEDDYDDDDALNLTPHHTPTRAPTTPLRDHRLPTGDHRSLPTTPHTFELPRGTLHTTSHSPLPELSLGNSQQPSPTPLSVGAPGAATVSAPQSPEAAATPPPGRRTGSHAGSARVLPGGGTVGGEKQRRAASSIQRALRLRRQLTPPFHGSSHARILEPHSHAHSALPATAAALQLAQQQQQADRRRSDPEAVGGLPPSTTSSWNANSRRQSDPEATVVSSPAASSPSSSGRSSPRPIGGGGMLPAAYHFQHSSSGGSGGQQQLQHASTTNTTAASAQLLRVPQRQNSGSVGGSSGASEDGGASSSSSSLAAFVPVPSSSSNNASVAVLTRLTALRRLEALSVHPTTTERRSSSSSSSSSAAGSSSSSGASSTSTTPTTTTTPSRKGSFLLAQVSALVPFKTSLSSSSSSSSITIRLKCGGAVWTVSRPYKAFVSVDAQLRGLAEPAAEPPLTSLPELPPARGNGEAKTILRRAAVHEWLNAVFTCLAAGSNSALSSHVPLSKLLELYTPLLVKLQARSRAFVARRRYVAAKAAPQRV